MLRLVTILAAATLAGCATQQPARPAYAARMAPQPADPHEWHVVSVTPAQRMANGQLPPVETTSEPLPTASQPAYAAQSTAAPQVVYQAPVVVGPQPYYQPYPYYYQPYYAPYYPAFTVGLDFVFGGRRGWGGYGHLRGHHPH